LRKKCTIAYVEENTDVVGTFVCDTVGKKYFDRGVPLYSDIGLIMNFIPNESPEKMGFIGTKQ
jgi:hypothetical protein